MRVFILQGILFTSYTTCIRSQSTTPTSSPTSFPCNRERYVEWEELSEDMISNATVLGYDNVSWNTPNVELPVESNTWFTLGAATEYVENLGFDALSWDCYINHYDGYFWNELQYLNFDEYMIDLGWNESTWNGELPPPEEKKWSDLTDSEIVAADNLCYTYESWGKLPLSEYLNKCEWAEAYN